MCCQVRGITQMHTQAIKGCAVSYGALEPTFACTLGELALQLHFGSCQLCAHICVHALFIPVQVFTELEIPHIYHSVARNSPKRQELVDKWDVFQVPYIEVSTGLCLCIVCSIWRMSLPHRT